MQRVLLSLCPQGDKVEGSCYWLDSERCTKNQPYSEEQDLGI